MRRLSFVIIVGFFVLGITAAAADDRQVCFSVGSDAYKQDEVIDRSMRACTRMIESGKFAGKNLAYVYRGRGYWKDRKGDYDSALRDFDEAIRLDPQHVEGYDYRASVWKNKGNYDRAIADLGIAIRLNPSYAAAYYRRGEIYQTKGDIAQARADYQAALAAPNKDRIAQWAQDSAREKLASLPSGGGSTSSQSGRELVNADDAAVCFSLKSEDYKKKEAYDPGVAACTRLIAKRTDPKGKAAAIRARGYWKHQKGELDDAIADYNRAIQTDPQHPEGFDYRADVFLDKGDLDTALADYDKATKLDPSYVPAYYSRGRIYEKQGKIELAKESYRSAMTAPKRPDELKDDSASRLADWARRNARTALERLAKADEQSKSSTNAGTQTNSSTSTAAADCSGAETHWKSAVEIGTIAVYQDHLARFPTCAFSTLAKAKIETLKK